MSHFMISDARIAGHCTTGTSNKVWVACLAVEQEGMVQPVNLTAVSANAEVVLLCGHGPYGAALRLETPKHLSRQAAQALLSKKWQEKAGKGYVAISFEPFVPALGQPLGLPLIFPEAGSSPSSAADVAGTARMEISATRRTDVPRFRQTAALVKAVSWEGMMALLSDTDDGQPSSYTVSEKANGERCVVEFDGTQMRAYNRKGLRTSAPPEGALALQRLGCPFVVDGERLLREHAGHYVLFDVLEWNGEDLTARPYRTRLTRLVRGMQHAGLLKEARLTPTLRQAQENSTRPQVYVLPGVRGAAQAQAAIKEVQYTGGEGVVIRNLNAPYQTGGFKYKFLEDIDAFVFGIEPGISAGSLKLALVRPTDGAIIEIGHVRSGLTDADVEQVRQMVVQGQHPVFRVRYLPASTVGITLVQPQTSLAYLRTDKTAQECTTDQFGPAKAALIAQARPIMRVMAR
ncbi:MAG TPA: hypothetical protein VFV38_17030 [Ktedonobacteraceae bacterium]|nr:hypothetical protein [Ktedonobacteraceae bacterium]